MISIKTIKTKLNKHLKELKKNSKETYLRYSTI